MIRIAIGAPGTIPKGLLKELEEWEIGGPFKLQHCWGWLEYWEESWWPKETFCHSDSRERPLANAGVRITQRVIIIINYKNNNNYKNREVLAVSCNYRKRTWLRCDKKVTKILKMKEHTC